MFELMAKDEHLAIIKKSVSEWNAWRQKELTVYPDLSGVNFGAAKLNEVDFAYVDLSQASFDGGQLSRAECFHAKLHGVSGKRANLSQSYFRDSVLNYANFTESDASHIDLTKATLNHSIFKQADLSWAKFIKAKLGDTDLEEAPLKNADLTGAVLTGANLRNADLSNANLTNAVFIGCDLTGAEMDNALVTGVTIQSLKGHPKIPGRLRGGTASDLLMIEGEDAQNFFHRPCIIEIHLGLALNDHVIGCYHFYLEELYRQDFGNVRCVGWRSDQHGTLLRFQASTYQAIYRSLDKLMAPFPNFDNLDWASIFRSASKSFNYPACTNRNHEEATEGFLAQQMALFFRECQRASLHKVIQGFQPVFSIPEEKQNSGEANDSSEIQEIEVLTADGTPLTDRLVLEFSYEDDKTVVHIPTTEAKPALDNQPSAPIAQLPAPKPQTLKEQIQNADCDVNLKRALLELLNELQRLKKERAQEEVEDVEDSINCLVKEAYRSKPRTNWYAFASKELIKNAQNLGTGGVPLIKTSQIVLSRLIELATKGE